MKICPECDCENTYNAKFCKNCGFELIQNENTQNSICPNCNYKIDERMKFCRNCGYKLTQKHEKINKTEFCYKCGTKLSNNEKFCPKCGISTKQQTKYNSVKKNKNPQLAAILSFFIPGLGQIYLGLIKKGIILFIITILFGFLTSKTISYLVYFIIWCYAIYDGYKSAKKINNNIN